jgi:hypothetical protein
MTTPPRFTCPVCGFPDLAEPHLDPTGSPTYSICPCCGVHFGADDVDDSHLELRRRWVAEGAAWWSQNETAPKGWNAEAQLKTAGFGSDAGGTRN